MAGIDSALVAAIAGESVELARAWSEPGARRKVLERVDYHGISGLLIAHRQLSEQWPGGLVDELRGRAVGRAMWELQHRTILTRLLGALATRGITAILLKGTAIAYDLYDEPAERTRGDTDILVSRNDVPHARSVLRELGFEPYLEGSLLPEEVRLQEIWNARTADGHVHSIDLHWSALHSHALAGLFAEAECRAAARPLPRLCETALALDRPRMLVHACVHRQLHVAAPYFVEDRTYYGGDRLIWFRDIFLLANSLSGQEWSAFLAVAEQKGVSGICLEGLSLAYASHGAPLPGRAAAARPPTTGTQASAYLKGSQSKRALMDLRAVAGLRRKLAYLAAQALPGQALMRSKYPGMKHLPVPLLYARRFLELVLPRPGHERN